MKDWLTRITQQEGHDLINDLEKLGLHRKTVYMILDNWLGERHPTHFSKVRNADDSIKIIKCLHMMIRAKKELVRVPKQYPYYLKIDKK